MINHRGHREHGGMKLKLRELAARSGRIVEFSKEGKRQQSSGVEAVAGGAALTGLGTWQHRTAEELGRGWRHLPRATQVLGIGVAGMGVERLLQERKARRLARQKQEAAFAARELAARSGRIVEFGDGGADEAVLAALKAAASADESPAQRAMLLKSGLIEMVKGQLVINERGYDLMKKAGMPPKLTPEERREEIAGTEEKRLSRFEFARGDFAIPVLRKIQNHGGLAPLDLLRGNTVNALKGNRYPALDGWNGYLSGGQIRKQAADKIRGIRKDQMAAELADAPFFKRHPGMKISTAIERRIG